MGKATRVIEPVSDWIIPVNMRLIRTRLAAFGDKIGLGLTGDMIPERSAIVVPIILPALRLIDDRLIVGNDQGLNAGQRRGPLAALCRTVDNQRCPRFIE